MLCRPLSRPPQPRAIAAAVGRATCGFWLDAAAPAQPYARYSIAGVDPFLAVTWSGRSGRLMRREGDRHVRGDPFEAIRHLLSAWRLPTHPGQPFVAGAVGYLGYDLARCIERLPDLAADDRRLPDLWLAFYDTALVIDHMADTAWIVATGLRAADPRERRRLAYADTDRWLERLATTHRPPAPTRPILDEARRATARSPAAGLSLHMTDSAPAVLHTARVRRALAYIAAGEVFQVNLARRLTLEPVGDPMSLYLRLRTVNPEPHASWLSFPGLSLLSASPELFLWKRGDRVVTRPIKGTRARSADAAEDRRRREDLAASPKERAELTMIVDLMRNDLGRVSRAGCVATVEVGAIEAHPHVFHQVATVTGRLAPGHDTVDLLRATFPGGSVTGAPKVRAMAIIEELEGVRRGPYTGAAGFLGFDGSLHLNMLIRTLVVHGSRADLHVGGGIVADSDPQAEYEETEAKAAGLLAAFGLMPDRAAAGCAP